MMPSDGYWVYCDPYDGPNTYYVVRGKGQDAKHCIYCNQHSPGTDYDEMVMCAGQDEAKASAVAAALNSIPMDKDPS